MTAEDGARSEALMARVGGEDPSPSRARARGQAIALFLHEAEAAHDALGRPTPAHAAHSPAEAVSPEFPRRWEPGT
jgi:hypothetical protein